METEADTEELCLQAKGHQGFLPTSEKKGMAQVLR